MIRDTHFKVIVKFNDGAEDMIYYYPTEKIANGVVKRYKKNLFVENVTIEEI